jgi:hypothetical protein
MEIASVDGAWAEEVARRVDPSELRTRWEVIECLHAAEEALGEASDEWRIALGLAIEGNDSRLREAKAQDNFERAVAVFRKSTGLAQRYVAGPG